MSSKHDTGKDAATPAPRGGTDRVDPAAPQRRDSGRVDLQPPRPERMKGEASSAAAPRVPAGPRRHTEKTTPGGVGLRGAVPAPADKKAGNERRASTRKLVDEATQSRQKRVWDKLDAARKAAEEKASRLKSFQPAPSNPAISIEGGQAEERPVDTGEADDLDF